VNTLRALQRAKRGNAPLLLIVHVQRGRLGDTRAQGHQPELALFRLPHQGQLNNQSLRRALQRTSPAEIRAPRESQYRIGQLAASFFVEMIRRVDQARFNAATSRIG